MWARFGLDSFSEIMPHQMVSTLFKRKTLFLCELFLRNYQHTVLKFQTPRKEKAVLHGAFFFRNKAVNAHGFNLLHLLLCRKW